MDSRHKAILQKHKLKLADELVVGDTIVQYLHQEDVLTTSQLEEIRSTRPCRAQVLRLLDLLPTRGPHAFRAFLASLQGDFPWVHERLLQLLASPDAEAPSTEPTEEWGIPDNVLQAVPSDKQVSRLADRLGSKWELVLLDLGLRREELDRCRADHQLSTHSQAMAGLVMWRQRRGREATVLQLLRSAQVADLHPAYLGEVLQP